MTDGETAKRAGPTEIAQPPSLADRLEAAIGRARTQGLGIALVALIVLFAVRAPGFATMDNFGDALRDLSILGILAIGETFVIIGGGIDLSVGSVLLLAGIVSDDLIRLGEVHTAIAIPIALGIGCIAGAINGLLITRLRISAFIVTLASLYMFRGAGLSLYRTDVQNLQAAIISDENFLILGQNDVFGIPVSFIIFAVLLGLGTFVLRRTRFGLHLYALGGSELAARLTRIRVARIQLSTYIISGFCSALAGIILASRLQTGAPEAGSGEEFDVIAAVIIGGASLFGGRGTLFGTLLGAAFITVLAKGQTLIGIPANYQSFTRGIVILIAVTLDSLSQRSIAAPRRLRWANILSPPPPDALPAVEVPHDAPQRKPGVPACSRPPDCISRSLKFALSTASISRLVTARCMPSLAKTAPAKAPSSRCWQARSPRTVARSASTARPYRCPASPPRKITVSPSSIRNVPSSPN